MTAPDTPARVRSVALALRAQDLSRRAAKQLLDAGIPVLFLKGPDLQVRLYGTPAAYASGDVDLLVPQERATEARALLAKQGWIFSADNGVLWRVSRAASFDREDLRLDLHWGLHAGHLSAASLDVLENRLWEGARRGEGGMLEPDAESLLVFLAVHVVGHGFERPEWEANVHRAAALVSDWGKVWRLASEARVGGAVHAALAGRDSPNRGVVLDGPLGRVVSGGTWAVRGHFIPRSIRDRLRRATALGRECISNVRVRRR